MKQPKILLLPLLLCLHRGGGSSGEQMEEGLFSRQLVVLYVLVLTLGCALREYHAVYEQTGM